MSDELGYKTRAALLAVVTLSMLSPAAAQQHETMRGENLFASVPFDELEFVAADR